jgi:NAD(P)-dependent dehydrogenase (short-subunit alcohol dehydrogenase family)
MLARVRRQLESPNCEVLDIVADISQLSDLERVHREVDRRFGGADILINNAAVYPGAMPTIDMPPGEWSRIIDTNLRAAFFLSRALAPGMIRNAGGRIVNIVSATNSVSGECAYRVSKIGLEVLTAAFGSEVRGTAVAVMAFNPGWMRTEMSQHGRSPAHAANAILELVGRDAAATNGKVFDLRPVGGKPRICERRRRPGLYGM